jgi:Arc/MetJ-type ribon-helix-helix transcriptional regulator
MTVQIAIRLPDQLVSGMDELVAGGRFANRTDVVRIALERLLADAREAQLDQAIAAGYRAHPDAPAEAWVEAAATALVREEPW